MNIWKGVAGRRAWILSLKEDRRDSNTWGRFSNFAAEIAALRSRGGRKVLTADWYGMNPVGTPRRGDAVGFYWSTRGKAPQGPGIYMAGILKSFVATRRAEQAFTVEFDAKTAAAQLEAPIRYATNRAQFVAVDIRPGPVKSWYAVDRSSWDALLGVRRRPGVGAGSPQEDLGDGADELVPEGQERWTLNLRRERKNRDRVLNAREKPWRCDACTFSFGVAYGAAYADYIQVHHQKPVAKVGVGTPALSEFDLLCANCHAIAHRGRLLEPLNAAQVKKLLARVGRVRARG